MPDQPPDPNARTESLYFRGSPRLREDAEKFGLAHGLTLSSALAVLTERGLEAEANGKSLRELERRGQQLTQEVAVLKERDRTWSSAFNSLQGQLRTLRVGKCPSCRNDVTAYDFVLVHTCPWQQCGQPLNQVVTSPEEFPPALAALVGALGGLVVGGLAGASGGSGQSVLGGRPSRPA